MQIILLEKVANLGNLGDVVKVKDGYARNFQIPSGQARRATEKAVADAAQIVRHYANLAFWSPTIWDVQSGELQAIEAHNYQIPSSPWCLSPEVST